MSKIKLLLDVVSDLRSLADSVRAVAETMLQNEENIVTASVNDSTPKTEIKPDAVQPNVTLEQVRMVLAEKSRNNLTAEVRELLGKYGAKKLSEVDSVKYAELLTDAEGLGNG